MSTILIYTSPARGHLYPMMDIAINLRKEGHMVVLQTLSAEKSIVESEGIEFRPISSEIEKLELDDYKYNSPISQIKSTFSRWLARAPYEVEDMKSSIKDFYPDLLIVDANTWGANAFAEAVNRPWVMFMPYCLPISSPETPAFGPGLKPPKNNLDRMRDKLLNGAMNMAFSKIIKKLSAFRSELGAEPLNKWEELFLRPDLLLYLTAEPFEYKRTEWPINVQAVGPGLWAPPSELPSWIDELPHPRVLVSVSTELQEDGEIIKTAIKAMENESYSVIITTAALDPAQFKAPNDRIKITRFLPHAELIPKVDVVVSHGGMGTTQRALSEGKPICVIPWGRDQNETARRVEQCGAGVMLSKKKLNIKSLRKAVLETHNKKLGAEKVAESFLKAGGTAKAIELINGMVGESRKQNVVLTIVK